MLCIALLSWAACTAPISAEPQVVSSEVYDKLLQIVANGGEADLAKREDLGRTIDARLFNKLLTLPKDQTTPHGLRIKNAIFAANRLTDEFSLPNAEVPYEVRFENCVFSNKVNLQGCQFKKGLSFAGSTFKTNAFTTNICFTRLQVDGDLDFDGATFEGRLEAPFVKVSGNLLASGASFKGSVILKQASVGHQLSLQARNNAITTFEKNLDCDGMFVGHKFLAEGTKFKGEARFNNLKIGDTLWMWGTTFNKRTSFGYVTTGGDFMANQCTFTNGTVSFYGLRCRSLDLQESYFGSSVAFCNAAIANDLTLIDAKFEDPTKAANFSSISVQGHAFLNNVEFKGSANFILAHIGGNFYARNTRFLDATDLNGEGDKPLSTYNADFGSLTVDGFTFFDDATFAGSTSFRNAQIQNLVLDRVRWPAEDKNGLKLRLEGLSYVRIRSISNKDFEMSTKQLRQSWHNLREMLDAHTPYSYDVYLNLEDYFRREGQPKLADEAFIEGKRRERAHANLFPKAWSYFLYVTVGNGRHPGLAFAWAMGPMLLGLVLFRRDNMQPSDARKERDKLPYHPIWYSFDLLLPMIGLWVERNWEPNRENRLIWMYACFHKFIGWVLIPIGLAAFAGIIK